ncbi:MAG: mandelate racemase [Chloroflexi bacterium]|nr:mandelate racemase [Chloroflexota bacterium]
MAADVRITGIEAHLFEYELPDHGHDYNGFSIIYKKGSTVRRRTMAIKVHTHTGVTGEFVGGTAASLGQLQVFARYLLGKNALERELIYNDVKRGLRFSDKVGMGPVDVALWDIAGRIYGAPIYQMLGGYRRKLPAYASTYHGEENSGYLDSPETYADFAQQCLEMGYPAFKLHVWGQPPFDRDVAAVHAVGKRVGGKMDLMLDGSCAYRTFWDALKVGRACDEEAFMWLEDPMSDAGVSAFAHRKLRQLIKTPILQMEMVRGVEAKIDFIVAEATDFVRADIQDGGITGVMKIAHAAEGFGLDVEIHATGPAQRHCMAAMRNANYYEMALVHPTGAWQGPPVYKNYRDGLDAVDSNGCVDVPEGPGLGVEYDWDFIMKHRVGGVEYK